MSEKTSNHKFFVRPKVRFDQQDQTNKLQNLCGSKDVGKNKPIITSIVNLKQPIKMISIKEPSKCPSNDKLNSNDDKMKPKAKQTCNESKINSSQKGQLSSPRSSSIKKSSNHILTTNNTLLHNEIRTTKAKSETKGQGNKENKTLVPKQQGTVVSNLCSKNTSESQKLKVPISNSSKSSDIQNSKKLLKSTCSAPPKKVLVHKTSSINKTKIKGTSVPIKKDLVRDIQGNQIKVSIDPGKSRLKETQIDTFNKCTTKSNDVGWKFKKSEYNSITSTIKELDKIKREPIVKDLQHLPIAQKSSLHKKVYT